MRGAGRAAGFVGLLLYSTAAVGVYLAVVGPALDNKLPYTAWADTTVYLEYARSEVDTDLLSLHGNYVGPVLLIRALEFNNLAVVFVNSALLLVCFAYTTRRLPVRPGLFAFCLAINPMTFASLLALNKEIVALAGMLVFACYLRDRRPAAFIVAVALSLFARWHQALLMVMFAALSWRGFPWRRRAAFWGIAAVLIGVTIVSPLISFDVFGVSTTLAAQQERAGGLLRQLNDLQRSFGYVLVVFPKVVINWFGNLARVHDVFDPGPDFDPLNLYNYAVVGHQVSMLALFLFILAKGRFRLRYPLVGFAVFYSVAFAANLLIQYRYFYPVYGLFCLVAAARAGPANEGSRPAGGEAGDLRVSVCMTSFNGERFVREQLESVLGQLREGDEVVLTDDASTDGTRAVVEGLRDPRIKAEWRQRNVGLFETLTRSLSRAEGDILFLCDQDDVWKPDKVEKILNVFREEPGVTLVLSDAEVIDGEGRHVLDRYLHLPSGMGDGTARALRSIVKNRYLGGAIAVRRRSLEFCLPIPPSAPMHDMWIGILNDVYGRTYYLPEPLLAYRRHDRNTTAPRRGSPRQILLWRYRLVRELWRRMRELRRRGFRGDPS
jgi:Glycosyl transferase family 2